MYISHSASRNVLVNVNKLWSKKVIKQLWYLFWHSKNGWVWTGNDSIPSPLIHWGLGTTLPKSDFSNKFSSNKRFGFYIISSLCDQWELITDELTLIGVPFLPKGDWPTNNDHVQQHIITVPKLVSIVTSPEFFLHLQRYTSCNFPQQYIWYAESSVWKEFHWYTIQI